jgi:hypothetical protein
MYELATLFFYKFQRKNQFTDDELKIYGTKDLLYFQLNKKDFSSFTN